MRVNRVVALTASALLALGLASCSSDSKDEDTASSSPAAADTAKDSGADAEDAADTDTDSDAKGSGGDFCATAMDVWMSFDQSALQTGEPAALHEIADSFREVAGAAEGDAATAWEKYADFVDLSADIMENPNDMSKMTELQSFATDSAEWSTAISDSLAACS